MTVLIAGGGIAGLSLALTCHQIGAPFKVFESVAALKPLGVGINLQPNAVRELFDLGFEQQLASLGVATREYGMFSKHGLPIWTEPRGKWAGYNWPQYSVHRGELHMLLYRTLIERAGPNCIETGMTATGFDNTPEAPVLHLQSPSGETRSESGTVVVGADGIHSALRAQMEPAEGPPIWSGAVLWRGTAQAAPYRTGATMAFIGHATQRTVTYPITPPDPDTGLATINWIAELTFDPNAPWRREDWNRRADIGAFLPAFADWVFDWIDIPGLIRGASSVYEYPMVDRDPIDRWTYGAVSLIGDAAHATYPTGSNGASQAIVDARKLGGYFLKHGLTGAALEAYQAEMLPAMRRVILANRSTGPDAVLQMVEDRCGGRFTSIDDVIPSAELAAHAKKYKAIAGFSIDELNAVPPTIPVGARL